MSTNINESVYTSHLDPSLFQSLTDQAQLNSIINNMQTDTVDRPIKFAKPKYGEVQKTYEVLAPITKEAIQLPAKHSSKVRTTETVFAKPIVLNENMGMSTILNNNELGVDVPLPTNSVINNLIKDSVMQSGFGTDINFSNIGNSNINNIINNSNYGQQMINESKFSNKKSNLGSNIGKTNYEQQLIKESKYSNNKSNFASNIGKTKYEEQLIRESKQTNSNFQSKFGKTKYEKSLIEEERIRNSKSIGMNSQQNINPKISEMPQPEVHEGEGLKYSNQIAQSGFNNSVHPSKVKQSNIPQQSIHSTLQIQCQMKQSNMHNQTNMKSNIPPQSQIQSQMIQSNMHNQSNMKSNIPPQSQIQSQMIQSNMNYQSNMKSNIPPQSQIQSQMQQSNMHYQSNIKSNIPPQSQIQSQIQQSNMNNKSSKYSSINNNKSNYQNSIKNSLPSMPQSQMKNSNQINNNNINNIKNNPIGVFETALIPPNIENLNKNIDNNMDNNVNNNPSNLSQFNNKYAPSVYSTRLKESNVKDINPEPQPGEYNIMNNKTTMGANPTMSFPTVSKVGENLTKTATRPNPFK